MNFLKKFNILRAEVIEKRTLKNARFVILKNESKILGSSPEGPPFSFHKYSMTLHIKILKYIFFKYTIIYYKVLEKLPIQSTILSKDGVKRVLKSLQEVLGKFV